MEVVKNPRRPHPRRSLFESLESRQLLTASPVAAAAGAALATTSISSRSSFTASAIAAATSVSAAAVASRSIYLTGNSITDGINYQGLAALLGLDGSSVTWGRQTGSGYQQAANLDLRAGYLTGGYDPANPASGNPWGNYQQAFAARSWDSLTLQPQERKLLNDVYNAGTAAAQNEAEVPISIDFMEDLAANSPSGQTYIYERPARRDDVNADLSPTGDTEHYSSTWLRPYNDSATTGLAFTSRSYFQQLMPLLRSAQAADAKTASLPAVKLIPVGEAYYYVDQMISSGAFNGTAVTSMLDMYRDQSHPSADLGAYVMALTFYGSITGNDPRGIAPPAQYLFEGSRLIDPKVQALLQQAVYNAITSSAYAGYTTTLPGTPPTQGQILASVYVDANRNSAFDAGEQPLPNVQVYLDTNNNGALDAGEPTQTTDANGLATFTGLSAGSYTVKSVPVTNYDVTAAFATVSLDGLSVKTTNEGLAAQVPVGTGLPTGNSTLSGYVVEDTNHDRQWSSGEAAIPNRTVWIDLNDDGVMQDAEPRTLTNGVGKFTFKVPAGSYRLREVLPSGWVQDVPSGTASLGFTVADGATKNINFLGYTQTVTANVGQIAVTVYNDLDASATYNSGDALLAGIPVYIDLNNDGQFESGEPSASTNSSGVATFTALTPGSYALRTRAVTGLVPSTPQPLTVTSDGLSTTSASLGLAPAVAGSEAITVFNDSNADGVQQSGESVLSGVTLYIDANNNGQLDSGELTAVTDNTGAATFTRLLAGQYLVRSVMPSGYHDVTAEPLTITSDGTSTFSTTLALTPNTTTTNPTPPSDPASVTIEAETGVVSGGSWGGATNHANFTGASFVDYGGNGSAAQWSITRNAAGAATLSFRYANGSGIDRPLTIYVNGVSVGLLSFPSTGSWDTWKNASIGITLAQGVNTIKAVAGPATGANVDSLTITTSGVTPPVPPATGSISGVAFIDSDASGGYNAGDAVSAGQTVFLDANANGVLDAGESSAATGADGSYGFTGLAAGTYAVREIVPGGYVASVTPAAVTLAAGQAATGVNLGIQPQPVTPPTPPASVTIEAETGSFTGGTYAVANHANYTGTGFADYGGSGSSAQWSITRAAGGAATLTFRYANGAAADRPLAIYINGANVGTLAFSSTGSWDTWLTTSIAVTLSAGPNTIKAVAGAATGGNIDSLTIT